MKLTEAIYEHTIAYPVTERYGLVTQMRRAAVSVPSNIAEGHARNTTGEYHQHAGIASGSLAELETQIILSSKLGFMTEEVANRVLLQCKEVGRLIGGLLKSLR